MNKRYYFTL